MHILEAGCTISEGVPTRVCDFVGANSSLLHIMTVQGEIPGHTVLGDVQPCAPYECMKQNHSVLLAIVTL